MRRDTLTSIERAKHFIQSKGRALALTLIPLASLAAIAVPANASSVTVTGGLTLDASTCSVNATGGTKSGGSSCTVGQMSAQNGIVGGTLSGTGSATEGPSGGSLNLDFAAQGFASGTTFAGEQFPIRYDVLFTDTDLTDTLTYTLNLVFTTTGGPVGVPPITGNITLVNGMGSLSNSTSFTIPSAFSVTQYAVSFSVTDSTEGANGTLSVNIPQGASIDLGGTALSGTPEPATFSLVGSAIAGLLFLRRRRKA